MKTNYLNNISDVMSGLHYTVFSTTPRLTVMLKRDVVLIDVNHAS